MRRIYHRSECVSGDRVTPHVNPISDEIDGYDFEAPTRFDKLFTGLAVERPKGLDPHDRTGCEGLTHPDEADYGRLLERAYVKVVASPPGFEPGF